MTGLPAVWQRGFEVDVHGHGRIQPGDAVLVPEGEASVSDNWLVGLDGGDPDDILVGSGDGGGP